MKWDPQQYGRFAAERGRPFDDLLARVGAREPRRVVDLGCGTGALTALLAQRWPTAVVEGIDSSPEMIAQAAAGDRLGFRVGDVAEWTAGPDVDVVISNATLQWVPTHRALITSWAGNLPPDGWLAFQVPGNFDSFSHALLRSLAESRRWASSLTGILRHDDAVGTPAEYAALLLGAGLDADAWETTYVHVLAGSDPVLEWMRGTALRPVMAALPAESYALFEQELADQLRTAYPPTEHGTLFPFRRVFAVGHRVS
jgi:trans-aconitate 2-methyltransferase